MKPVVKIRGIYATALTRFLQEQGARIVQPSDRIARRFGLRPAQEGRVLNFPTVQLEDRLDRHGVLLFGWQEHLEQVETWFRDDLEDAVFRRRDLLVPGMAALEVEFPALSKTRLDAWRALVVPTVPRHHRLRIAGCRWLDAAEQVLELEVISPETLSQALLAKTIDITLRPGARVHIDHVKPDGRVIGLSPGVVESFNSSTRELVLRRTAFLGRHRYDGLNIPKEKGDYAISTVREGNWYYRHDYFHRDGRWIGALINLNTPVEFYPGRIRYVDLELDVVQWPDGRRQTVDEVDFQTVRDRGYFTQNLAKKTRQIARELEGHPHPGNPPQSVKGVLEGGDNKAETKRGKTQR